MHTRTAAAGLLAAGLLLTACSSSSDSSSPKTTTPASTTAATAAAKPTTAPTVSDAPIPNSALATGTRTAACWRAIRDQYEPGTVQFTGAPTEPPACLGLSTDEVSAVAADVLAHQLG